MAVEKNFGVTRNFCLPVITWNQKYLSKQVVPITYTLEKLFFAVFNFEASSNVSFQSEWKTCSVLWFVRVFFEEKIKQILFVRSKFIFLCEDSLMWQSVKISGKRQFKMLVVFSHTFVADTKIFSRYNIVVPLKI